MAFLQCIKCPKITNEKPFISSVSNESGIRIRKYFLLCRWHAMNIYDVFDYIAVI